MDANEQSQRWQTMLAQAQRFAEQDNYLDALARARLVVEEATAEGQTGSAAAARECVADFERRDAVDRERIAQRRQRAVARDLANQR